MVCFPRVFFLFFWMLKYDKHDKWSLDRCVSNLHHWHVSQCYRGDFLTILFLRWIFSRCWLAQPFLSSLGPVCQSDGATGGFLAARFTRVHRRSRQHIFPLEPPSRGWSVWFGVPRRCGRILIWNTISQFSQQSNNNFRKAAGKLLRALIFTVIYLRTFLFFPFGLSKTLILAWHIPEMRLCRYHSIKMLEKTAVLEP